MIAPRISDIRSQISAVKGEQGILPCVAQGRPIPSFSWHRKERHSERPVPLNGNMNQHRFSMVDGVLIIQDLRVEDSGVYICIANNSISEERAETVLKVRGKWMHLLSKSILISTILDAPTF